MILVRFAFKALLVYISAMRDVSIISLYSHYIDNILKQCKSLLCDESVTWRS